MSEDGAGSGDSLLPQLARLPAGRHGLPREFVASNHRDRLIVACVQEVQQRGYGGMTVASIIARAAVSRRTFYEFFDSKEACFLAVYNLIVSHLRQRMEAALAAAPDWPQGVRAAIATQLEFFASEPELARFCMVEPLAAGPPVSSRHRAELGSFAEMLRPGRALAAPPGPREGTEEAVSAGLASLVTRRIAAGRAESVGELLPDLVETVLTPFLGSAEAERVAGA